MNISVHAYLYQLDSSLCNLSPENPNASQEESQCIQKIVVNAELLCHWTYSVAENNEMYLLNLIF